MSQFEVEVNSQVSSAILIQISIVAEKGVHLRSENGPNQMYFFVNENK